MKTQTSCGIVVFHKDAYLILHYEEDHWDLPKGHIEENETHEQTAIRETKEETNLDVEIMPGFKETITYFFRANDLIKKTVHFFVGEAKTKDVKLSHEHKGYDWLSYEDA